MMTGEEETGTLSLTVPADAMVTIQRAAASASTPERPISVEDFVLRAATQAALKQTSAYEPPLI